MPLFSPILGLIGGQVGTTMLMSSSLPRGAAIAAASNPASAKVKDWRSMIVSCNSRLAGAQRTIHIRTSPAAAASLHRPMIRAFLMTGLAPLSLSAANGVTISSRHRILARAR